MSDEVAGPEVSFDVWGCRGSRNLVGTRSRIGSYTSCYSVLRGEDLYTFDAGEGLAMLGWAMTRQPRFAHVKRAHVLVTHAHVDHWEGLKDVDWFWTRDNGLDVTIYGAHEALDAVKAAFQPPSYVPLDILAMGTVARLSYVTLAAGARREVGGATLDVFPLHHYSGMGANIRHLDALGYLLTLPGGPGGPGGPAVAYLSDHEPTKDTGETEDAMLARAQLAVFDAHFPDIKMHAFGHGSQEYTAGAARRHPGVVVLAGHHGPGFSDETVRDAHQRHGAHTPNFHVAVEGMTWKWNPRGGKFEHVAS